MGHHGSRDAATVLLALMLFAMVAEIVGVGAVLSVVAIIVGDPASISGWTAWLPRRWRALATAPNWSPWPGSDGHSSCHQRAGAASGASRASDFTAGIQAYLSDRLLASYLTRPYAFHLERNLVHLLSSINKEARDAANGIHALLLVVADAAVLIGIIALLIIVSPGIRLVIAAGMGGGGHSDCRNAAAV